MSDVFDLASLNLGGPANVAMWVCDVGVFTRLMFQWLMKCLGWRKEAGAMRLADSLKQLEGR